MTLSNQKKDIIFISISSDLYGASKAMLKLVLKLNESHEFNPIVCLPCNEGPLAKELVTNNVETIELPVLLLTRSMLKGLSIGKLIKEYRQAKFILDEKLKNKDILCIQSNTLATLLGYFYARKRKYYHIVHVHEIVERPRFVKYFFAFNLRFFTNKIVYNSRATEIFYNSFFKSLAKKSTMIYNGVDRKLPSVENETRQKLRLELFKADSKTILIGLVGRINRLKGQQLLLNVFNELSEKHNNVKLCFVGSPPINQEHFLDHLNERIREFNLEDKVTVLPFQKEIYKIMDLLDIVAVPSTEAESFGIVAVEAMLSKKPVIASRSGGLLNIIEDEKTGILFNPSDEKDFLHKLELLINNDELAKRLAENASIAARSRFSSEKMYSEFLNVYNALN